MKKLFIILLTLALCLSAFYACGKDTAEESAGDSKAESALPTESGKPDESEAPEEGETSEESKDEGIKVPHDVPDDILKDLPYTIVCKDKYTDEVVEYPFDDNGRLNDGEYRNEAYLENEVGDDMRVDFEGTSSYNLVITFEADGTRAGNRLIAHNCDFNFSFLKIELGDSVDNLTEIEFEDDFEATVNGHGDNYADFELSAISTVRITITTGTANRTSFDEFTLISVEGEEDTPPEESSEQTPEEGDGAHDPLLIGSWGADDPEIVEKGGSDYKLVITFVSDGTGNYKQAGFDLPMTWYTEDGTLYMEMPMAGQQSRLYHFEDGCLIMPDEDGRTTTFVKLQA